MLVDGTWSKEWEPVQKKDEQGRFVRQVSSFRENIPSEKIEQWLKGDKQSAMYQLYVAYICPWATRALIARQLLGLENVIDVKIVQPQLSEYGWQFGDYPGSTPRSDVDVDYIYELYTQSDQHYTGRATVPVLWDIDDARIVNNESADILRILNHQLRPIHKSTLDLYPEDLQAAIDKFNDRIYSSFNNGVYKSGFASSQFSYNEAVTDVFSCLDELEKHFSTAEFAVGNQLTESDIRLFVTLARFDVAYHGLFKTNIKRITDYQNLSRYFENLLDIPAFRDNTNIDHIKAGYYSIKAVNPTGIVPIGPELPWFHYLQDKN